MPSFDACAVIIYQRGAVLECRVGEHHNDRRVEAGLETWEYGTVAQVLHLGPYDQEKGSVERLKEFVEASGYEIVGPHEEEYLSRPDARTIKTVVRYRVKRAGT